MPAKIDIEPVRVLRLAAIGCTDREIASFFDCAESTIRSRFRDELQRGRDKMKASIKRRQFQVGVGAGNVTMLIWLGKQHLGQRDRHDVVSDNRHTHEHSTISETAGWVAEMLGGETDSASTGSSTH